MSQPRIEGMGWGQRQGKTGILDRERQGKTGKDREKQGKTGKDRERQGMAGTARETGLNHP